MTRDDKRRFIRSLTSSISRDLCAKVPQMPPEWDGHELRKLLAIAFAHQVFDGEMGSGRSKRVRNFENERITRNL